MTPVYFYDEIQSKFCITPNGIQTFLIDLTCLSLYYLLCLSMESMGVEFVFDSKGVIGRVRKGSEKRSFAVRGTGSHLSVMLCGPLLFKIVCTQVQVFRKSPVSLKNRRLASMLSAETPIELPYLDSSHPQSSHSRKIWV